MRVLGLDLGTKTLGMAISDETMFIASGLETFHFKVRNFDAAYRRIDEVIDIPYLVEVQSDSTCDLSKELIAKYDVKEIVIGLPYYNSGDLSPTAKMVLKFKEILETRIDIPVYTQNESYSSFEAESYMLEGFVSRKKRKEVIDKMAAVVILQSYLDHRGGKK